MALDMRLYTREQITGMRALLLEMLQTLHALMKEHLHTCMPGFTHLQKAQPVTLAHHLGAYFEMFKRDADRCADIYERMIASLEYHHSDICVCDVSRLKGNKQQFKNSRYCYYCIRRPKQ